MITHLLLAQLLLTVKLLRKHYQTIICINQSRQPEKGDVVTYSDHNFYKWLQVQIITMALAKSKYTAYCNIQYLDKGKEDNRISFTLGQFWSWSLEENVGESKPENEPKVYRHIQSRCQSYW